MVFPFQFSLWKIIFFQTTNIYVPFFLFFFKENDIKIYIRHLHVLHKKSLELEKYFASYGFVKNLIFYFVACINLMLIVILNFVCIALKCCFNYMISICFFWDGVFVKLSWPKDLWHINVLVVYLSFYLVIWIQNLKKDYTVFLFFFVVTSKLRKETVNFEID